MLYIVELACLIGIWGKSSLVISLQVYVLSVRWLVTVSSTFEDLEFDGSL